MKGKALQKEIATRFGISPTQVSYLLAGRSWGWLA
jgi:hypothetical protein